MRPPMRPANQVRRPQTTLSSAAVDTGAEPCLTTLTSAEGLSTVRPAGEKALSRLSVRNEIPGFWGHSSAGRARDWQSRGQGFDPPWLHQILSAATPSGSRHFFVTELGKGTS